MTRIIFQTNSYSMFGTKKKLDFWLKYAGECGQKFPKISYNLSFKFSDF